MRFRLENSEQEISDAFGDLIALVGEKKLSALLDGVKRGVNLRGFVSNADRIKYSLTLQVHKLYEFYRKHRQISGCPEELFTAVDMIIGIGQLARNLSVPARNILAGKIVGGIKTGDLGALHHELRVAGSLSRFGFDVEFSDYENKTRCDFIASRDSISYEVDAKCASLFRLSKVQPEDAEELFLWIKRTCGAFVDPSYLDLIEVDILGRFDRSHQTLQHISEAVNEVLITKGEKIVAASAVVRHRTRISDTTAERLRKLCEDDVRERGGYTLVSLTRPRFFLRVRAVAIPDFDRRLSSIISESSKKQLLGDKPALIWLHLDHITTEQFDVLVAQGLFRKIATRALDSEKRQHLVQVAFSGGSFHHEKGGNAYAMHSEIAFHRRSNVFQAAPLLPESFVPDIT